MSDLISVIVPIYNVEKYLNQCVESIVAQTYHNLEIILIDDGSLDQSGKIADEWAIKDERIMVVHKENGGLSDGRNWGIERAHGSFLVFVDSDDFIHPKMIETLYQTAIEKDAELVWSTFVETDEAGVPVEPVSEEKLDKKLFEMTEMTNSEACMQFYMVGRMSEFMVAWNKIYKASLFEGAEGPIRYPKGRIYEDGYTTYQLVYQAKRVIRMDIPLYYYRIRKGSIMEKNGNVTYFPAMESGLQRLEFYAKRDEKELYKADLNMTIYSIIRYYEHNKGKQEKKDLKNWFRRYYYDYFVKENWPLAKRIRMRSFLIGYPLYHLISSFEGVYNKLRGKG